MEQHYTVVEECPWLRGTDRGAAGDLAAPAPALAAPAPAPPAERSAVGGTDPAAAALFGAGSVAG